MGDKTMSDDLRDAADRLRRDEASPRPGYFSPVYAGTTHCPDYDAWMLCRAWLADNPADDGEPVTEEWLATIGQRWNRSLDFVFGGRGRTVAIECRGAALPPPERRWYFGNHPMPTRGHVRRLLLALGIEVPRA